MGKRHAVVVSANEAMADRPVCVKMKGVFLSYAGTTFYRGECRRCQDNACGWGSLAAVSRARGFVLSLQLS